MVNQKTTKGANISKMDAVRRILAERGMDTMPTEIQKFAKERFGLNITTQHVSVCKTEIRHREAKAKLSGQKQATKEPAQRSLAQPAPTAAAPVSAASSVQTPKAAPTKMDAMRRALSALGKDAQPLAIQAFLKKEFNLDMTRELISKYKSDLARAKGPKPKALPVASKPPAIKVEARQRAPQPAPASPPAAPVSNSTQGIDLKDIQTVKALVGRVGAEQFRKLIDLLGQ